MQITTDQIKELRDETGVSVMQCKKALEEADGDLEKAKIILRKISKQSADKKASRTLGAGAVASYIHGNGSVGAMVELLCETDFVARNEDFKALVRDIAMHITAMDPENLEELLNQEFIKSPEKIVKNLVEEAVQKFGERTEIGRFARFSIK
ncbi:MAG: translation elongation factor Ts [Patescibacteria group bacterium]